MSKKVKTQPTAEQIYKKNKKKAKILSIFAPIVLYFFLLLAIIFFYLTVENSVGNITEILNLLNKDNYSGIELEQNYAYLTEKWGEWEIIGAGSAGLVIRYVDVGNALFSGLMMTFSTLTVLSLCIAIVFGKMVFPMLAKHFRDNNDEMVDLATLKSATQIDQMSKKEWF